MSTSTKVAPASFTRTSTPARMARSAVLMWSVLGLACVFFVFIWWQTHENLQAFGIESARMENSIELVTDFQYMANAAKDGFTITDSEERRQAWTDYNFWRDAAVENMQTQASIPPVPDPLSFWQADTEGFETYVLKSSFAEYQDGMNAARGDKASATTRYNASAALMKEKLVPAATTLYGNGQFEFSKTAAVYKQWHGAQIIAICFLAALMTAFIAYQYQFMVRRGKRGAPALTCIAFLLCAVVCTYAYLGMRTLDTHAQRVTTILYSSEHPPADAALKDEAKVNLLLVARDNAARVTTELRKADSRICYLPTAPFVLFLAGLLYQIAVNRSTKDYR